MLNKDLVFDEIYQFFGKKLLELGFKTNKNKTNYTYSSDFVIMIFDIKLSKGKIVHLTFCLNQHDLQIGKILISYHLDDKKYSDWIAFIHHIDEVKKLQPSYDRILEIVQNSFINKMKSMHDLYNFLYHKSHKTATDYIYQLIIAKVLDKDYFKVYAEIRQEQNFLHMMTFYQAEVDFAFHHLKDYPIQEI